MLKYGPIRKIKSISACIYTCLGEFRAQYIMKMRSSKSRHLLDEIEHQFLFHSEQFSPSPALAVDEREVDPFNRD